MADQKVTQLTALTAPAADDLLYIVDDVSGTPTGKKLRFDKLVSVHDVVNYGADPTGATDSAAAILAADAAAEAAGGDVYFPAGTYRVDSQLIPASTAGSGVSTIRPRRWVGDGAWNDSTASVHHIARGTILDCRYASGAALLLRPRGGIEICGITFHQLGTAHTQPYVKITNMTTSIHHCAFIGHEDKVRQTCDQDAIVFGGTLEVIGEVENSPFQGYGTVVQNCFFDRIKSAGLWQTWANGIVFQDSVLWGNCGGDAAFKISGAATNSCTGAIIANNVVEITNYERFVDATNLIAGNIDNNGLYDPFSHSFTADAGTDVITVSSDIEDLAKVYLTTTGTLPAGLSLLTPYWVIGITSTTIKLATSYANAVADTEIDITDAGTGTHTINYQDTNGLIKFVNSTGKVSGGFHPENAPNTNVDGTSAVSVIESNSGDESKFPSSFPFRADDFRARSALFDGTSQSVVYKTDSSITRNTSDAVGLTVLDDSDVILFQQQRSGAIELGGRTAVAITTPTWYLNNAGVGRLGSGANFIVDTGTGGSVLTLKAYRADLKDHNDNTVMSVQASGVIKMVGLPTSDPVVVNQLWNDSGTLKISAG